MKAWQSASSWCVGFSGGLDSTVLLHILANNPERNQCPPVRAIHVYHGLQVVAQEWPAHCQRVCDAVNVPLQVVSVKVATTASLEGAAREARYAAFAEYLVKNDVLLLAQHQDDQAETLLFRLLRGGGLVGLQGIPEQRTLGQTQLFRPLLGISRAQLEAYAHEHGLRWVTDPSNADDAYDRNYLRLHVMPRLQQRWPSMLGVFQRTTEHMAEATQLLDELAQADVERARIQPVPWLAFDCLDLQQIQALTDARQKNLLAYWLRDKTAAFDSHQWRGWFDLRDAKVDSQPCWHLNSGAVVREGSNIYWLPKSFLKQHSLSGISILKAGVYPLTENGFLEVKGTLPQPLYVRYRQGGEVMSLSHRGRRDLKRLMQEEAVPRFIRSRLPLICNEAGEVLAVANYPRLKSQSLADIEFVWFVN